MAGILDREGQWQWTLVGIAYGLLLRVVFGAFPGIFEVRAGVMSAAFLVGMPAVVGALTVYGGRKSPQSIGQMIFTPWFAVLFLMLGSAVTLLEGSICIALMAPLFLGCASIGGLAMGLALRFVGNRTNLRAVTLLPFAMFAGEMHLPLTVSDFELRSSMRVHARPELVWAQILDARAIEPSELPFSLTHLIGVPRPVEGVNVITPDGEVRFSKWERGVNFKGKVIHRRENETITWRYIFDADSFPPGSMDDHVAIGGRYFNLRDTTFNLHRMAGNETRLEIVAHYSLSTAIDFYAVPMAQMLGHDFARTILTLYKRRSETTAAPSQ